MNRVNKKFGNWTESYAQWLIDQMKLSARYCGNFECITFSRRILERVFVRSIVNIREKGRDLTQTFDKNPYTHRTIQKATWQHKNATNNFDNTTIADFGRSVGVTAVTQLVCLNRFTSAQPSH